jgi:hypothetical protein
MNPRTLAISLLLTCGLLLAAGPVLAYADGPFAPETAELPQAPASEGPLLFEIEMIDPAELSCDGIITFDDIPGSPEPGTNYDVIFESDGADFAERFVGQALSYSGDFDVLSGMPSDPLALQTGLPNENLVVLITEPAVNNAMSGLGPQGYPEYNAIGEGAFAVLFDFDQSEFGFDLLGGNGGNAYVSFFRRDGSLIDVVTIPNLSWEYVTYGFRRVGGVNDIAGISIHNDDPGGFGVDNLCHDVPGVQGDLGFLDIKPTSCPNPLNVKSNGVLPVALLGTDTFDVALVDLATVQLEGVDPIRHNYEDVATPIEPGMEDCYCHELGPDGYTDLTLKFRTQDIVAALGDVEDGDVVPLTLTGEYDGTAFEAVDCIWVLDKTKGELATEFMGGQSDLRPSSEARSWSVIKGIYR